MNKLAIVLIVITLGLLGCKKSAPEGDDTNAEGKPDKPKAEADKPSSGVPPVDRSCKMDSDCKLFGLAVDGPEVCCPVCGGTPGSVAWNEKASDYCDKNPGSHCSNYKCRMLYSVVVCDDGQCVQKLTMPPVIKRCSSDDDCTVSRLGTTGDQVCCYGCDGVAVSKNWESEAREYCADHPNDSCLKHKCDTDDGEATCKEGECVLTE